MSVEGVRQQIPVFLCAVVFTLMCLATPLTVSASSDDVTHSPVDYRSTFSRYQKFTEQPLLSWREASDVVEKIGGWRFYAREANHTDAADTTTDPKTHQPVVPSTGTDPHSGHEVKP